MSEVPPYRYQHGHHHFFPCRLKFPGPRKKVLALHVGYEGRQSSPGKRTERVRHAHRRRRQHLPARQGCRWANVGKNGTFRVEAGEASLSRWDHFIVETFQSSRLRGARGKHPFEQCASVVDLLCTRFWSETQATAFAFLGREAPFAFPLRDPPWFASELFRRQHPVLQPQLR